MILKVKDRNRLNPTRLKAIKTISHSNNNAGLWRKTWAVGLGRERGEIQPRKAAVLTM